jgi:hypothetical protein
VRSWAEREDAERASSAAAAMVGSSSAGCETPATMVRMGCDMGSSIFRPGPRINAG